MRTFLLYSEASTTPFNINDMPSSGRRMDLVARCVNSAIFLSDTVRRDTKIFLFLNGPEKAPKALLFEGEKIKRVYPDERSIGSWINKALEIDGKEWSNVQEGISISNKSLTEVLEELDEKIYILDGKGKDIRKVKIDENPIFVLGDNKGLPKEISEKIGGESISVGPIEYLSSQCITIVHNELDRKWKSKD